MKVAELKQKGKEELKRELLSQREKLRQLKFDLNSGKIKNIKEIKEVKKTIARIMTILKEK